MTLYANMKFPPVPYQEYPRLAYPDGNKKGARTVLCQTEEEYEAVMGGAEIPADEGDVKASLIEEGRLLGLKIDARWSEDRMRNLISDARSKAE